MSSDCGAAELSLIFNIFNTYAIFNFLYIQRHVFPFFPHVFGLPSRRLRAFQAACNAASTTFFQ